MAQVRGIYGQMVASEAGQMELLDDRLLPALASGLNFANGGHPWLVKRLCYDITVLLWIPKGPSAQIITGCSGPNTNYIYIYIYMYTYRYIHIK